MFENLKIKKKKRKKEMSATVDTILSNYIDLSITFIVPLECTYGIITNIINIIIFSKKSLKVIIFKYCRINAIFQIFVIF